MRLDNKEVMMCAEHGISSEDQCPMRKPKREEYISRIPTIQGQIVVVVPMLEGENMDEYFRNNHPGEP